MKSPRLRRSCARVSELGRAQELLGGGGVLLRLVPARALVEFRLAGRLGRCELNATDWKRLCQEANATPAGRGR
jgi:hypothetical protein